MKRPSVWEGRAGVEGEREVLSFDVDVGTAAAAGGGSYRARLVGDAIVLGRLGAVVAIVAVFLGLARAAHSRPRHRTGGGLTHLDRTRSERIQLRQRRGCLGKLDAHNK